MSITAHRYIDRLIRRRVTMRRKGLQIVLCPKIRIGSLTLKVFHVTVQRLHRLIATAAPLTATNTSWHVRLRL
ncbi:hypothetical protein AAMO2058_001621100 [Amorphochlora amoebiformis]